jgi:hypothetical protein
MLVRTASIVNGPFGYILCAILVALTKAPVGSRNTFHLNIPRNGIGKTVEVVLAAMIVVSYCGAA